MEVETLFNITSVETKMNHSEVFGELLLNALKVILCIAVRKLLTSILGDGRNDGSLESVTNKLFAWLSITKSA